MNRNKESLKLPSLVQHFDAPENHIGQFGWLCGYSADISFLNDAAERFTRLTRLQRAAQGRIALAMLLDPGNPHISLQDAPGILHLPIKDLTSKPFKLLHAKIALLGFRHQENHSQWQLRLLVSTGNWTRQTLENSLDLVWRIDIASESLSYPDTDIQQNCADIESAWSLLAWIQQLFDTRLLKASPRNHHSETTNALQKVSQWISACSKKAQGQPRVFDNRDKSLLSQLPQKVKACGDVKRNYLAMGSGFFEESTDHGTPPKVPLAIVSALRSLLTNKPEVDLYVNPIACQAIATAVKPLQSCGMTIRPAAIPKIVFGEGAQRSLHAKFLFSANYRDNSNACNSAWVYLGSGNLTHPGFANKMSASAGNLEAGVVFAPNSLYWRKNKTTHDHQVVTNLLPIQWDYKIDETTPLSAGSDMENRDALYIAPPIAWLRWHEADGVCELRRETPSANEVQALDLVGIPCSKIANGFEWRDAQPREVRIRWQANGQTLESLIPVVDQYGRIAATVLPVIDIEEAWWQLADFPMPPEEDGEDDEYDEDGERYGIEGKDNKNGHLIPSASYPIRQMMNMIESIAAKQTEIVQSDWDIWCNRLEQTLGQATNSASVKYFRDEIKLNPLSPLRQPPFRPSFAENSHSALGKLYDETLFRIEVGWEVNELDTFGEMQ